MDGQRVCQVRTNFRQTFLFQAETFVRFVKGHTELMRSGGKRVLELNRLARGERLQVCGEKLFAIRKDGQRAFVDSGNNFDVKGGGGSSLGRGVRNKRGRRNGIRRRNLFGSW